MGNGSLPPEDPEMVKLWKKEKEALKCDSIPNDEPKPKETQAKEPTSKSDDL